MFIDMSEKEIIGYNMKKKNNSKLKFIEKYDGKIIKDIDSFLNEKQ